MWKTSEGSTGRLLQLCLGYFLLYVIYGLATKYFQVYPGGPKMPAIVYVVYSTIGGMSVALGVILICRWYKFDSIRLTKLFGLTFPSEFYYIAPAGLCTAIIIVFTTLMYSIKGVSIMVAMVLMRACVIVISRAVDYIQIRQKILTKKVYWQENIGIVFALLAISIKLFWSEAGDFDFFTHPIAMTILCTYVTAYAFRIYIMNYFKNTRPPGTKLNNKSYFAIEQICAVLVVAIFAVMAFNWPVHLGGANEQLQLFRGAITHFAPHWSGATLAGCSFGVVAFFSVFIFMFKGRTATFAGLVNRLTSLVAGTTATLLFWFFFQGKFPEMQDWLSLVFIFIAIGFISAGEKRRIKELIAAHEIK